MGKPRRVKPRSTTVLASSTLVVAVLLLAACGGSGTTASSPSVAASQAAASPSAPPLPTPTLAGAIAFQKVVDPSPGGNGDIYVVKTDGTGLKQLTDDPGLEERAAWSPDGRRIAYGGYPPGWTGPENASVWIMNADGSGKTRLTEGAVRGIYPSWSPDGKQIAFVRPFDDGYRIFVMNADGSHLVRVTRAPSGGMPTLLINDLFPAWAPGGQILFMRLGQVFVVNMDGSGLRQVTKGENIAEFAVSPDGKRLALYYNSKDSVVVLPTNGGGNSVTVLEPASDFIPEAPNAAPAWTPDRQALALASSSWVEHQQAGGSRLYVVNADGSGLSAVPGIDAAMDPAWRPQ
jgi:Tol biopolymer transport system component